MILNSGISVSQKKHENCKALRWWVLYYILFDQSLILEAIEIDININNVKIHSSKESLWKETDGKNYKTQKKSIIDAHSRFLLNRAHYPR